MSKSVWVKKRGIGGRFDDYVNITSATALGIQFSRSLGWSVKVIAGEGAFYLGEFKKEESARTYRDELIALTGAQVLPEPPSEMEKDNGRNS